MTLTGDCAEATEAAVCSGSLVLIDIGNGPRLVVAAASPFGRALLGARVGQRVRLRTAGGPRLARVLAVQSPPDPRFPTPRAWPFDPVEWCPSLVLEGPNRP